MIPLINFTYHIVDWLFSAFIFCLVANAIASWLVAFNIINPRNAFVYQMLRFFDAVTAPVLAPLRRVVPLLGGVDVTPVIAWVLIGAVQQYLLPPLFASLAVALGGGGA
jgi:YggT family protein